MAANYGLFETRTMLQALEEMFPAETFLKRTFFKNQRLFDTKNVDLDFYKGKRRTAAYVSPVQEGNVLSRLGYTTQSITPPYIKEKTPTIAGEMILRHYGETIYAGESPLQRAQRQFAIDMQTLDDSITRAEEVQCAQALFTGQSILQDGNALVFPMAPTHQITALEYEWTDTVNSSPLDDLRSWKRMVATDSGVVPNMAIFGFDVVTAFLAHPKVANNTAAFSSIKVDRGQINPQLQPEGVTYLGYLNDSGLDVYAYDATYIPAGAPDTTYPIPLVPNNKVFVGSSNARMDALYGPILDMDALVSVTRFPKSWREDDPSVQWLMLQASPIMVPWQVDSYMFATVVPV